MSNGVSIHDLLNPLCPSEVDCERISHRKIKPSLSILDPDPTWPTAYTHFFSLITTALGPPSPSSKTLLSISHVGSTSIPDLPAKGIIDIDIVVPSVSSEELYVPALESQGFQFVLREPKWYGHRFFITSEPMFANVHVWESGCAEVERHRIFKEWLLESAEDRELYAKVKREASEASKVGGETMMEYTGRKDVVVKEILGRAFKRFGIVAGDEGKGE